MNRTLRWFPQSAGARRRTARDRRARRPQLEPLESLRLMSVSPHGGPVISHPEVETVYWGQDWSASKGALPYLQPNQVYGSFPGGDNQRQINEIDNFFTNITNSPYMDLLNQYGAGRGLFEGHDIPPASSSPPPNGATVTDPQIQSMLNGEILAGRLPSPLDTNQLYFVFMPPNVVVNAYGATSTHDFSGYHYLFEDSLGQTVHYAVIPYPDPALVFGTQTFAASHELAEAATDPELNGWYDTSIGPQHGEIGDLAFPQGGNLNGYSVSSLWSNKDNAVVLPQGYSHATSHSGYIGSITALTNVWGYPYIFGIGSDGTVYYKDQDFSGNWSGWNSIGAPSRSSIIGLSHQSPLTKTIIPIPYWYGATSISVINDGSAFRVFAIGKDNAVYTYAQGDSSWTYLGGQVKQVVAGHKADGQLEVFAIGLNDNVVYSDVRTGTGSGGWAGTTWNPIAPFISNQTLQASSIVVDSSTGKEQLFAVATDGSVKTISEQFVVLGKIAWWSWGSWTSLGTPLAGAAQSIAVGSTADGRLEVFAIDKANYVESIRQDAPFDWSTSLWHQMPGYQKVSRISVGETATGREQVFAIDTNLLNPGVVSIAQAAPNDGWTDSQWFSMGMAAREVVPVYNHVFAFGLASPDFGRLTLAAVFRSPFLGGGQYLVTSEQSVPDGGWN
jgi:hypothetical protein